MAGSAAGKPKPLRFFVRLADGSVRLRIRFTAEEADLIEQAAGDTPLLEWLHRVINQAAYEKVQENRRALASIGPPRGSPEEQC